MVTMKEKHVKFVSFNKAYTLQSFTVWSNSGGMKAIWKDVLKTVRQEGHLQDPNAVILFMDDCTVCMIPQFTEVLKLRANKQIL